MGVIMRCSKGDSVLVIWFFRGGDERKEERMKND